MKVAVIGPGAMGCLYAAKLQRGGVKTFLVDHNAERASRLDKSGITIESGGTEVTEKVNVVTQAPSGVDLVIVLTKAYSTGTLRFPPEAPILSLQNGLGNVETLCSVTGSNRVIAGTSSEAATLLGEGRVRHVAPGTTSFGAWTSCDTAGANQALRAAGFQVEVTEAPGQLIWEKVSINAGINPLAAIMNVPNGRLLEVSEVRQLMRDLVVEAAKVASTEGYRFGHSLVELAEETCRRTSENVCSMLQDIRNGKQTEIDNISGEILRRAQVASLPTPRTRVVYQLVRGLERR